MFNSSGVVIIYGPHDPQVSPVVIAVKPLHGFREIAELIMYVS